MRKFLLICFTIMLITGCSGSGKTVEDLKHISLEELDQRIVDKTTMVVYFGWTKNCDDSKNFQENYLEEQLNKHETFEKLLVVDLDKEAPKALKDKKKREPLKEKYNVMYSPTLIYYKDGEIKKLLEWTPETTDKNTGIFKTALDSFFKESGYLEK